MKRILRSSTAIALLSVFAAPATFAATPAPADATTAAPGTESIQPGRVATACLDDVQTFSGTMQKDGHWMGASAYGYGYPMGVDYGYGASYPDGAYDASMEGGYRYARQGYEVRNLIASATILAQNGEEQLCQAVLAATQGIYTSI